MKWLLQVYITLNYRNSEYNMLLLFSHRVVSDCLLPDEL